jgi:glycerol uptake facilitator protein
MLVSQVAGGTVHWGQLPVYLLAEFVGGIAAGLAYTTLAAVRAARPAPVPVSAPPAVAGAAIAPEGVAS